MVEQGSHPDEGDHRSPDDEQLRGMVEGGDGPIDMGDPARAIEAILMVADEPVESGLLAQLIEISVPLVDELCSAIAARLEQERRGFALARVAGGWRFQTHPELAPYVERFVLEGRTARLSAAGLETLAIVAYKQPISRAQVSSIRGVNVDGALRTLVSRGLVIEVGRDPGPGQAVLYGTSSRFLESLGMDSLDDLPPLAEFVPDAEVIEALERGLRAPEDESTPESGSATDERDPADGDRGGRDDERS